MRGPVSCNCVLDPSLGSPALVPSTTSDNSSRVVSDGGVLTNAVTAQLVVDTGMSHALGDRALSTIRDSAASPVDIGSDLVDLEGYASFALITQMLLGTRLCLCRMLCKHKRYRGFGPYCWDSCCRLHLVPNA
jgi:hypothetical protein